MREQLISEEFKSEFSSTQSRYTCTPATSKDDFISACKLVHDRYCTSGYMTPLQSGMRISLRDFLPSTTLFVVKEEGRVVGTSTGYAYSNASLPAYQIYPHIVDSLIQQKRELIESSKFASIPEAKNSPRGIGTMSMIGSLLTRAMFDLCRARNYADWLLIINPKVKKFYMEDLGFELLDGEVHPCEHVENNPGYLLRLPLRELLRGTRKPTPLVKTTLLDAPPLLTELSTKIRFSNDEILDFINCESAILSHSSTYEKQELLTHYPSLSTELSIHSF